jgi:hypothetical protein
MMRASASELSGGVPELDPEFSPLLNRLSRSRSAKRSQHQGLDRPTVQCLTSDRFLLAGVAGKTRKARSAVRPGAQKIAVIYAKLGDLTSGPVEAPD